MQTFAVWLRAAREKAGLSQDRLAAAVEQAYPKAGVYQARITSWELSKSLPSLRRLTQVCHVFQLTEEEAALGRSLWDREQIGDLSEHPSSPVEPLENQESQCLDTP